MERALWLDCGGTSDRLNDVDLVDIEYEDLFIIAINPNSFPGIILVKFEKVTFYTENLTRKVELWIFSLMKKHHKTKDLY